MSEKLSFQDVILRLLDYWREQGCLIWQAHNVQVGAGTMNPATVLRVLGPEPWNVAYIEPSIRPDDGRFGDNPNRMQQHYQLQVILKPDPGDPQDLYLKSLEAIGINPREHDIRFVEDNWQSPALGAWGLGWEVWLDGQEITQFTYFQQAGGHELDPVSVELTYGLDRIVLALQDVDSVWDINYGSGVVYGDALLQQEIEHCKYYFNVADVDSLRTLYDIYENEAKRCIEAELVAPAHDYNLKCSHIFNIMDTRGAIGVTERQQFFARMRDVARQISDLYVAQRHELEYPFLDNELWQGGLHEETGTETTSGGASRVAVPDTPQPFVLEIGSEELPAGDLYSALRQLRVAVPELLEELRLAHGEICIHGTPRRLAVIVEELAPRQTDLERVVKGPPAERAFDVDGNPTRAAEGFARGKGIGVHQLTIVEEGDKRYAAATIHEKGRPAVEVLAEALPGLIAALRFEKSMRWNQTNIAYSRPLRWIVALHGRAVVPFHYAGVTSGRISHGLRPMGSPAIAIDNAADYEKMMAGSGIVVDVEKRRDIIRANTAQLAAEKGGVITGDPALLAEVTNLVERPTPLLGSFERRYLELPSPVLIAVMKKHQRYFPVQDEDGQLLPYFIAVRNGDREHLDMVRAGNEHVIRARFADAAFFYGRDTQRALADFLPDLATLTFQFDLGSMLDKVHRLEQLAPTIGSMIGLDGEQQQVVVRAAALSKADLATSMVVEMTSLQGVMGGHYALRSGEPEAVAAAIAEQYETVSATAPGLALALADRLDSLTGLFAVGLAPKGSNDPFALRRAAIQIVENLIANEQPFDLREGIAAAAQVQPVDAHEGVQTDVLAFITGRLEVLLREQGLPTHVVRAVLAAQAHNPFRAARAARALHAATTAAGWDKLLDAYARSVRITRAEESRFPLRAEAFAEPEEQALLQAYHEAAAANDGTVETFVASLRQMEPVITTFFENILVMDEDAAVRENRLALLQHIAALANGIADLSELEGF
ncbi:MAG: glycine--tRNA ligase subunit beta [Anaerolineae bacterium]|nr:glycine--tRNA ligase subunit beta [Anaerolineae bacterium]